MNEIKLLILDVDGTLTDGKIYMGENGEIMKAFNAHDAVGVRKLKDYNITPIIITGRISKITENRAKEMYVDEIYQNIDNKLEKLESILKNKNISYKNVAYIGDDENDLECMKKCAFCACPNDAMDVIKKQCNYISNLNGGQGAVRDIIEYMIKEI